MQNITVNVEGDKLVLTVDLSQEIGPSSSGETVLIASTEGNANVPGHAGVKVGLRPPPGRRQARPDFDRGQV